MQEIYDFLKKCGTYYLATTEGSQPRVRPFGTVDIFEDNLYIQTGKVKNVSRQILANPQIEICAFDGGHWLRIEAQKHMLDGYPNLQAMYQPGDGNTQVFYLKDATATFASFTDEPRVIHF